MTHIFTKQRDTTWKSHTATVGTPATASVTTFPTPSGAPSPGGWGVSANGQSTWVHPVAWGSTDTVRLARFISDAAGAVAVVVETGIQLTSAVVEPLIYGITPEVSGTQVLFDVPAGFQGHLNVRVNGSFNNQLMLDILEPIPAVVPGDWTYYFGPGYHTAIGEIVLESGESCYIDGGALVAGKIRVGGGLPTSTIVSNVDISGYGILDSQLSPSAGRQLRIQRASNVTVFGIAAIGVEHWGCVLYMSNQVTAEWMTIINARTLANVGTPDGFDVVGSSNVILSDTFIRSYDDATAVKGESPAGATWYGDCSTIRFSRITYIQGDGGNCAEIGYEMNHTISDVEWSDCIVIRKTARPDAYRRAPFGIHADDSGLVQDVAFRTFIVESNQEFNLWVGKTPSATGDAIIKRITFDRILWPNNTLAFVFNGSAAAPITDVEFIDSYLGVNGITDTLDMTVTNTDINVSFG